MIDGVDGGSYFGDAGNGNVTCGADPPKNALIVLYYRRFNL